MTRPVFLGSGLHTCLGVNVEQCVEKLRSPMPTASLVKCDLAVIKQPVPYFLMAECEPENKQKKFFEILSSVIAQALDESGLNEREQKELGLFVGSSSFEVALEEERYEKDLAESEDSIPLAECGMGNLAERIRDELGIRGPDFTFNTACTSSANAVWYANKMVERGDITHALVVAVEFSNRSTTYGFQGLQLLSSKQMLPFDERRDGLVLGESCAALVLGKPASQPQVDNTASTVLKKKPFYLIGAANLCDTFSMSVTNDDGNAVAEVIQRALSNANLSVEEIDAIKCHGTATLSGDAAEARGMLTVFDSLPLCTALKPYIGHTLGACGLSELILFFRAVMAGFIPGTPQGAGDTSSSVDFSLSQSPQEINEGNFVLNYFGFGGNNTSLIISNK